MKCPVCGKKFSVLWPNLWRYRRGSQYLCGYGCMRLMDKGETVMEKFTKEQKQEAIRIALAGGDPKAYLKSIGSTAPDKLWYYMKTQLLKKDPETYERLAGARRPIETPEGEFAPATVKLDGPIRIETPETGKVEVVKISPPGWPKGPLDSGKMHIVATTMEYRTTGISTPIGDWQYIKKAGYLDWTPLDGNGVVSLSLEEWKELMKLFPEVLKVLEVKL